MAHNKIQGAVFMPLFRLKRHFLLIPFYVLIYWVFTFPSEALPSDPFLVKFSNHHLYEDARLEAQLDQYLLHFTQAQDSLPELQRILEEVTSKTPILTRIRAHGYYVFDGFNGQTEAAKQLAWILIDEAEESGVLDAIIDARSVLTNVYYTAGDTEQALVEAEQIQPYLDHASSPRIRYFAHNLIGRLLQSVGDYEDALQHFILAAEAVHETNNELTLSRSLLVTEGISHVYASLRHYDVALSYISELINMAEAGGLNKDLARLYLFRGYLEGSLNLPKKSIYSHEKAIEYGRQFGADRTVLVSMNNIGSLFMDTEEYEQAQLILREAWAEAERQNDLITMRVIQFNLSYVDVMLGNPEQGIVDLEQAVAVLRPELSDAEYVDNLTYIIDAYIAAKHYEKAIAALKEQRQLSQDLAYQEHNRAIAELQIRYRANEQAAEIRLLAQRNQAQAGLLENARLQQQIFALLGLVIILAALLLFLAWRATRRANLKLQSMNEELQYQSIHDPLTSLLNRRSFQVAMHRRQRDSDVRHEGKHGDALLLIDIDFFKKINDRVGHAAGDKVLVEVARRLKKISRHTDMVVRWGGEEFLIYLREMNPEYLAEYTERVLAMLSSKVVDDGQNKRIVTATAGFVTLPLTGVSEEDFDWERCLQVADMALYMGKVRGRNQGIGILELLVDTTATRQALESDLSLAIEKGWVRAVYVNGPNLID